jgi:hypothetical protein
MRRIGVLVGVGLAFTESAQYAGTTSDASNGGGADGAIHADVTPGAAWTMPAASLRGGFRYLTLFADTTDSIAVDRVSLAISFAPSMADLGMSVPTEYASLCDMTPTRHALTTLYDHQAASGQLPYAGPQVNFTRIGELTP